MCSSQCVPVLVDCTAHITGHFHKVLWAVWSWWSRERVWEGFSEEKGQSQWWGRRCGDLKHAAEKAVLHGSVPTRGQFCGTVTAHPGAPGQGHGGPPSALQSFPTPRTHTWQRGVLGPPYSIHLDTCHLAPVERNRAWVNSANVEGLGGGWLQSLGPACNGTPGRAAPGSPRRSLQGGACGPSLWPLLASWSEFLLLWSGDKVASLFLFGCPAAAY